MAPSVVTVEKTVAVRGTIKAVTCNTLQGALKAQRSAPHATPPQPQILLAPSPRPARLAVSAEGFCVRIGVK